LNKYKTKPFYVNKVRQEAMIIVKNLSKTYVTPTSTINALNKVNLQIQKGDIFGIIGFSGAGKSTLIRCLNRLEEPDGVSISIKGQVITDMDKKQLRQARRKIGMIFQQFNLFDAKTVFENVAFPLEVAGYPSQVIHCKVQKILDLVGLTDKAQAYPLQLSGGQKQRVGIARALSNDPDVLLSDEATSALDPQTTYSILELLKDINEKLGVTIVLITHELDVLKHICNKMAVIEQGEITETGPVEQFFLNPKSDTAKRFISILQEFQSQRIYREGEGI
jgi:D-methionine transport system ATP-binding protein